MNMHHTYSASESDTSECSDNTYCVFLHIVEAIGLSPKEGIGDNGGDRHKGKIMLNASLNGVKFEVEGHSTETATIFNSNCIWECDLGDIKRMKTDNRPVKLECFWKSGRTANTPRKPIGTLLLPMRGQLTVATIRNLQLKLHWHKLGALNAGWRQQRPEIYLLLIIVKKTLIDNGQFETFLGKKKSSDLLSPQISETAGMLQSKSNIYVQLLEQVGLIQVGNNPDVDCDIYNVSLTFRQVRHLGPLLERERHNLSHSVTSPQVFVFHYDFLGSASHVEIVVNASDCYTINEKITLSFKSSMRSLRHYFQRIFYVPINLYLNGLALANYRLDFSKLLPDDDAYFSAHTAWTKQGNFHFDRLHRILSPRAQRPAVDFVFSIQLLQSNAQQNCSANETFTRYILDPKAAGDLTELYRNVEFPPTLPAHQRRLHADDMQSLSSRNVGSSRTHELAYVKCNSEPILLGTGSSRDKPMATVTDAAAVSMRTQHQQQSEQQQNNSEQCATYRTNTASNGTDALNVTCNLHSVGVGTSDFQHQQDDEEANNNEPNLNETLTLDTDDLTIKIVEELEEWKQQQMQHFLQQLELKETAYLAELSAQQQTNNEQLNAKLEQAQRELSAHAQQKRANEQLAEAIKQEIQHSYADKFLALELEMKQLQTEMHQKGSNLELQQREMQLSNSRLEQERNESRARVADLEQQLSALEQTHLSANELKAVLSDLRVQTERFAEMEKSKTYYKAEWAKTTRELHKLKLSLLQQQEACMRESSNNNLGICLDEILSEEQDALNSDRSDLKSIKEQLFVGSSETSSTCDFEDD